VFEGAGHELFLKRNGKEQSLGFVKVFISGHSNQSIAHYWCFVYFSDSLNRSVSASPPVGGSGFRLARSLRYASFPRQPPPTFCRPWKCYAFPYSGRQNVANSRNVRCNMLKNYQYQQIKKIKVNNYLVLSKF
jgi:hypothetical protein